MTTHRSRAHLGHLTPAILFFPFASYAAEDAGKVPWLIPGSYTCSSDHLIGFSKNDRGAVSELHLEPKSRSFALTVAQRPREETYSVETHFTMMSNDYGPAQQDEPMAVKFTTLKGEGWLSLQKNSAGDGGLDFVVFYVDLGEKRFLSGRCSAQVRLPK